MFSGQPSGSYLITVYDQNSCFTNTQSVVISNPSTISASAVGSSQVSCNNANDGSITVSAFGGTGAYSYSLNGAQPQTSNLFSSLESGSYIITVFDQNNCSAITSALNIANPLPLGITIEGSSQVSCHDGNDGTITANANGGTGSYSYSLNGGAIQNSNVFTDLPSGTYNISVYDENNCFATSSSFTITNPLPLVINISASTQVSCNNFNDGVITITTTGGTGVYSYSINNSLAQTSNVFSNLSAGTYLINVIDSKKCSISATVVIANPNQLSVSITGSSQVSCNNSSDGVITALSNGGTGVYSYSLNGGIAQSSNIFSNLSSGSYIVTLFDSNNCSSPSLPLFISNPEPLSALAIGSAQVSCNNSSDGSITANANGGTGTYSYSLNGGQVQSSNIFTGLTSGTYVINVTDENECFASTSSIIIANPEQIAATAIGSSQVSCNNENDGSITVSATGGTGSYSYSLNGGQIQSSNIFTGLASGSYIITVYDEFECFATTSSVVIANPEQITASAIGSSQVSCYNESDGSITVTASGGTGSYSYSLNGGQVQSSNLFTGLVSGSYIITVYDEFECFASTQSIIIANPDLLSISAVSSSQVSCYNANDGIITVTAQGGTGTYSYILNSGQAQSSNIFSGLTSGSYTIKVYDENNCVASTSEILISNPIQLTVSAVGSAQVSCNNASDASITVTATGGTGYYSYSLNGGISQSSNVFSGLTSGSYVINVFDQNNCLASTSEILISNPAQLTASAVGSAQVSCNNASDASITVTATGGTGYYSYSLNGNQTQSSNIFNGLTSGSYLITVFDQNNCFANSETIMIENPTIISASAVITSSILCYNGNNGELTVIAQGGTGSYSYSLNGNSYQPNNIFTGLVAGSYSIIITDEFGCTTMTNQIQIDSPDSITITAIQTNLACFGTHEVIVEVSATGGTPSYQYSIDGGVTYQSSNSFDSLSVGILTIYVMDANNCISQAHLIKTTETAEIIANLIIISGNKCYGINDASLQVVVNSDPSLFTYILDNGELLTNNTIENISAGNHTLDIIDPMGCGISTEFHIIPQTPINVEILSVTDANCAGKKDGSITIEATGGQGIYQYNWSNGQITPSISGLDAGDYYLTVTDIFGCKSYFNSPVFAGQTEMELGINNVFTPNGDGVNDLWTIDNLELYPDNQLAIFNRWGNEVLTVKGYTNDWNGSQLNEGTYFYILKVNMCDEDRVFNGYITILR